MAAQPPMKRKRLNPENESTDTYQLPRSQPTQFVVNQTTQNGEENNTSQNNTSDSKEEAFTLHRFMNFNPIDDLYSNILQYIYDKGGDDDNIEIEAKIGLLMANGEKDKRVNIPVKTASIVDSTSSDSHFQSQLQKDVFKHLNNCLNNWYRNAEKKPEERLPNLQQIVYPKIKYHRSNHIDKIYENHIRVTFDVKKPMSPKCIRKTRIADMEIYFPKSHFDARISISIENESCPPKEQVIECIRLKDRISYVFDIFSIDITVTHNYKEDLTDKFVKSLIDTVNNKQAAPLNHGCEITFEAEIEIIDMNKLREEKRLAKHKQPNCFGEIIHTFKNHILHFCELASAPNFEPVVCKLK